jgi:D,D-heptose 1,7-bisphosphate phosphatase
MKKNTAIFLDRDGTINEEVGYLGQPERLRIIPAAFEAVRLINKSGMKAIVISNQSGVARGFFTEENVREINKKIEVLLGEQGAFIDRFYFCPHHPTEGEEPYKKICSCRKPQPGMLYQAADELDIDLTRSYMIGDNYPDIEAAHRAGAKGVLVLTGYGRHSSGGKDHETETQDNRPDHIASDILEAVRWIMKDRR